MSLVKYQVERRPIAANGNVLRGLKNGDYILTLTDTSAVPNPAVITSLSKSYPRPNNPSVTVGASFIPAGMAVPVELEPPGSHVQEIVGEPWIVHSTHFSIESALESAASLSGAIGKDNMRIVQVLSHNTEFKLQ